ncbi:PKD domain-containing protein [Chitinophagaceae bacterium LWZ2-11]
MNVIVNPSPNDDFSSNTPQCLNGNNFAFTLSPSSGATTYAWDFGDGNIGAGTSPAHSYTIDGLYPVKLTVTSNSGCTATVQHTVLVKPSPLAQFVYNTIAPNSNDNYQFTDKSIIGSGTLAAYAWDFGDGNTSTTQNPTHAYAASGTYTITLTVTSVLGCSATVTQTLIVNKDPNVIAGFTINNSAQCISGNSFAFTDATTTAAGITVTGYTWNFGDGSPINNTQNPTHTYAIAGSYVITQQVTGTDGINSFSDNVTQTVIVYATPDMQQPNDQVVCNGTASAAVFFKPIQPGLSFNWAMNTDIGGGTNGTGNIPSFTANNPSNTAVISTVTVTPVANGCSGTPKTFSITVNPTPNVTGYGNQIVCAGSPTTAVNFTSNVSGASFTWFNDNTTTGIPASGTGNMASVSSINSSVIPQVSHITVTPAANTCGGTAQSFTITVNPIPVLTSILNTGNICSGSTFHYSPTSTTTGANFTWSRTAIAGISNATATGTGDPNEILVNTTTVPVQVTYVYTVTANGCPSAATYNVTVTVNPAATLSSSLTPPAICSGVLFSYLPASAVAGTSFTWSRAAVAGISNAAASGNGNPNEVLVNTTASPIVVTYAYTLTANGCASSVQNVQVTVNPLPVAGFSINLPIQCLSNNSFVFTNTSTGATSYTWNLDDGTTTASQNVTHVYQTEGGYNVVLTATSAAGCTASITKFVQVNPTPKANFIYNVTAPNSNDSYEFISTSIISSGSLANYLWNFGDGASAVGAATTYTYNTDNTFTVQLVVTSLLGCSDTAIQDIIVTKNPNIVPGFTINNTAQCLPGNSFVFTNTTTSTQNANTLAYNWDFGDSSARSNDVSPNHVYAAPGAYIVRLTVTGNRGYVAVLTQSVIVFPTPSVVKPANQTSCNGTATLNVNFTGGVTGTTYNWTNDHPEIGLAASGNGNILSFIATNPTNVPIIATITVTPISNGCAGTAQNFTITVNPTPSVNAVTSQILCAGQPTTPVQFIGNVAGTTFKWLNNNTTIGLAAAGNGDIASFTSINTSNLPSIATIQVAPFANNCFNAAQNFTITVNPVPVLSSVTTTNAICDSATFNYTPLSNVAGTVFTWTRAAIAGIANAAATGTGNPNEVLHNTTVLPVQVTYVYTLTANGCASNVQNVTVTVNPRPILTSSASPAAVCNNTVFSYTPTSATPGTAFDWIRAAVPGISNTAAYGKDNPNETLNNSTVAPISVNYAYTLSAFGCYNTYNVGVTVNPLPVLTSSATPTAVCSGTPFSYQPISTTQGVSFAWTRAAVAGISNSASTGIGNINETLINTTIAAVNVTYVYTLTFNGCTAVQNVTVSVNPSPTISSVSANQTVCAGQNINNITITGPLPGTVYSWSNNNPSIGLAGAGTGSIAGFVAQNPYTEAISGTITVNAVAPSGCTLLTPPNFVILVNPTPSGTINVPLGTNVCTGSSIPLIATGGSTYQWYNAGTLIPGATAAQLVVTAGGIYSVSATTGAGCSVQQTGNVTVKAIEKPIVDFAYSAYCINQPITFTDKSNISNSGAVNYLWADNVGHTSTIASPTFTYAQTGNYVMQLTVTPQLCVNLAAGTSKTIPIEAPEAGIQLPVVNTVANTATQLQARNIGNTGYLWVPAAGLNNATIADPIATLSASQQYLINMTMPSTCVTTDTLLVKVLGDDLIFIPNSITPNGDGKNDKFVIIGLFNYPGSELAIYNRWQNEVYHTGSYNNDWDATGLNAGTYYYLLKLRTTSGIKVYKGWIEVVR